jgi:hypothetical protein
MKQGQKPPLDESRNKSRNNIPEIHRDGCDERAAMVKTLICRGLDRATILVYATSNKWHEEPGDIDHYIEAANLELANDAGEINTETELGKAIARLNHLYMESVKVQDFKTALAIQKEVDKILTLKVTADKLRAPATNTAPAERPRLKIVKK